MSCPRLLPAPLPVHDVRDLEAHVRATLDATLDAWRARLDPTQYEDALAYLITAAWILGQRYEPTSTLSFSTFSRRLLPLRLVQWYRDTFGDARYGQNGREVSYDALVARRAEEGDDDAGWLDRNSPGARSDRVDELHRGAHTDSIDDLLTRAAIGL